jgi:hypothetical protein
MPLTAVQNHLIDLLRLGPLRRALANSWTPKWRPTPRSKSTVAYYIVAHQDDWQLFMSPSVYCDIRNPQNEKVVFVYVTAGDAGFGPNLADRRIPYYLARESAANAAVRFLVDIDKRAGEQGTSAMARIEEHSVQQYSYENTVSYFVRLPDGGTDGNGFSTTGNQSLRNFRNGMTQSITAIDNSAVYASWTELVRMVHRIIVDEMGETPNVSLNIPDADERSNPESHSDHVYTSLLVQEAVKPLRGINRALFADYVIANKAVNLQASHQHIQAGVFAVTAHELVRLGYPNIWEPMHLAWLGRQYLRVE